MNPATIKGSRPRIEPVEIDAANGRARELLDEFAAHGGHPGPMVRGMAQAPVLLRGYLDLNRAMKRTHLDRSVTERIGLAVQAWIGCGYCLAAHTEAARELGVKDREIDLARMGTSADPKIAAIVAFAQQIIAAPAEVTDEQVAALHNHGYCDEHIGEVVGLVALQLLTGAFNLVAGTEREDARAPQAAKALATAAATRPGAR